MATSTSKFLLGKLFIAVPELQIDEALLALLRSQGLVTDADLQAAKIARQTSKKTIAFAKSMRNKTLIQRLMLVVPEVVSFSTIDTLRSWGLLDATTANEARIALRAGRLLNPKELSDKTALQRWSALAKTTFNRDTINYLRALDNARLAVLRSQLDKNDSAGRAALDEALRLSILRGEQMRSLVSTGKITTDVLKQSRNANDVWAVMTTVFQGLFSDTMLKNAIRAGAISPERFELLSALNKLGLNVWRKIEAAADQKPFMARALLVSEGILSPEMVTALIAAGILPKGAGPLLFPAARAVRAITRGQYSKYMKGVRFRVRPGEAPIKSFAKTEQFTDRQLLNLLAQASKDLSKEAEKLMSSKAFGKMTKAAQKRVLADLLNQQMRALWENQGHLTIFGEKEAARAALASSDFLQSKLWKYATPDGKNFRRTIQQEAESAVDAFISRQENLYNYSRRVYTNESRARGLVERRINLNLLKGSNAKTFANDVASLIRPNVRGGVSYASMRLARTEINNAFHNTQIRYTREMPWVTGYKWHLSGSHPSIDICNTLASEHGGIYKKAAVPQKPHPHCLCYITPETASNRDFSRNMRSGAYDQYFKDASSYGTEDYGNPTPEGKSLLRSLGPIVGAAAARYLIQNRAALIPQ